MGDPRRVVKIANDLLDGHGVYIQPINYPTVPRGEELLRVVATPHHTHSMINRFVDALLRVFIDNDIRPTNPDAECRRCRRPLKFEAFAAAPASAEGADGVGGAGGGAGRSACDGFDCSARLLASSRPTIAAAASSAAVGA